MEQAGVINIHSFSIQKAFSSSVRTGLRVSHCTNKQSNRFFYVSFKKGLLNWISSSHCVVIDYSIFKCDTAAFSHFIFK